MYYGGVTVPIMPMTAAASAQWKRRVGRSQTRVRALEPEAAGKAATEESVIEKGAGRNAAEGAD